MHAVPDTMAGWSRWEAVQALTLRHEAADEAAREAVLAQGLPWPSSPGEFVGRGPWLARLRPQEVLALSQPAAGDPEPLKALRHALAPGRVDSAVSVDLSEALAVIELHGPDLDGWMSRLVDASAIPGHAGRCSRCRLADVAVTLLLLDPDRVLLLVERPLAAFVEDWLAYTLDAMPRARPA